MRIWIKRNRFFKNEGIGEKGKMKYSNEGMHR